MKLFREGEEVVIEGDFTDRETGEGIDPGDVTFALYHHNTSTSRLFGKNDAEVVSTSAFGRRFSWIATEPGLYMWEWRTEGDYPTTLRGMFTVNPRLPE